MDLRVGGSRNFNDIEQNSKYAITENNGLIATPHDLFSYRTYS